MKRWRWRLLVGAAGLGLLVCVVNVHSFLAITRPVNGEVLVVEGWLYRSCDDMREAAAIFKNRNYRWLVTVGDPVDGEASSAEMAAGLLRECGVDEGRIVVLPVPAVRRHQTYSSALTVRDWVSRTAPQTAGVDVFTRGTHARKSLVLFRRALGPDVKVGVFAGVEDTYDASRWWMSSRGLYVVSRKALGYLYAVTWPLPEAVSPE